MLKRGIAGVALTVLALVAPAGSAYAGDPTPSSSEREFVGLLNQERVAQGLNPVEISPALTEIADDYVAFNAQKDEINHDNDGPYTARANAAGCGKWNGPVLAQGYNSPREVLDGWLGSPGHRAVLLDPEITHIGPGNQGDHWLAFGMPCAANAQNTSGDFGSVDGGGEPPPEDPPPESELSYTQPSSRGDRIRIRVQLASDAAQTMRLISERRDDRIRGERTTVQPNTSTKLTVEVPRSGRWHVTLVTPAETISLGRVQVEG